MVCCPYPGGVRGSLVDLVLIVLIIVFAVNGYRQGFLVGALSFCGFFGGALVGLQVAPLIVQYLTGAFARVMVSLALVFGFALLGQSVAAWAGFHGQANYAAAKAGVIALTKVLSKELAKRQITVNAVAPGVIQTQMLGELKPEVMAEYLKQIPLGRLGQPDDVANAVLFLASEESGYVTGQVLPVTGGWF